MSLKQHGHFATNGFVFPLFRQMLQNTEKSTLNLWIVVNRIKCKRLLNSKPITRRRYIHTFSFFVNVHLLASGMFFIEYLHSFRSMVFMDTGIIQTESARPVQLGAYQMYMWQMSSVFSHESAQRNDAGHLIDKNVFKTTRSFCYQWFRVSTLQANSTKHGKINFKPMNRS